MSKTKARAPPTTAAGVYKSESIKDVAESLGITSLPEVVASALASDVEYRLHQVVEEAAKFMRHARRTVMTTADIDQALRVLNIEPLYGHSPHAPTVFRRAGPLHSNAPGGSAPVGGANAAGAVYFVEDEEIEFDRVLREDKIQLPRPTRWHAHWLAVEGVQPLIPENPPAIPREAPEPDAAKAATARTIAAPQPSSGLAVTNTAGTQAASQAKTQAMQQQQLVKQVLSRELQLYYTRLTSSLQLGTNGEDDPAKRTAALASLRHDAGLQALLPYLVRWVGEGVVGVLRTDDTMHSDTDGKTLEIYLDAISALLENSSLFVEPYLHQLLPPLLSTLLHSSLPPSNAQHLRISASQMLSNLLTQHSTTYPSLSPRIMKTLLLALISPGRSKGTREGAIRGLTAVGKEAIRKGLVECGGARVVGTEYSPGESNSVVSAVLDALNIISPPSAMPQPLRPEVENDAYVLSQLHEVLGPFFAQRLQQDGAQAEGVLRGGDTFGA